MTKDRDDDGIGYCRPPKKHRFKKGKSGNPKGRPKGAKGLKTDLKEELASQITVKIAGKEHTGTKQRLMLKAITLRAATGDSRAAEKLFSLILTVLGAEDEDAHAQRLTKGDQEVLEQFIGAVADDDNEGVSDNG